MFGLLAFFRISDTTRDLVRLALIVVIATRAVNSVRYFFKLRSIFFIASAVVLIVLAFGVSMTATEENHTNANIDSSERWSLVGRLDRFHRRLWGQVSRDDRRSGDWPPS